MLRIKFDPIKINEPVPNKRLSCLNNSTSLCCKPVHWFRKIDLSYTFSLNKSWESNLLSFKDKLKVLRRLNSSVHAVFSLLNLQTFCFSICCLPYLTETIVSGWQAGDGRLRAISYILYSHFLLWVFKQCRKHYAKEFKDLN